MDIDNSGYRSALYSDIVDKGQSPTYTRWLKDQPHGHYICTSCELEIDPTLISKMFDDDLVLTSEKGGFICPLCDVKALDWWTRKDGVVFLGG